MESLEASPEMNSFLEDPSIHLLQVISTGDSITASIHEWQEPPPNASEVHFIKLTTQPITEINIGDLITVGAIRQSPLSSLLASLQHVYATQKQQDEELTNQLKDLTAVVNKSLNKSRASKAAKSEISIEEFKDIQSLPEEAAFWTELANTPASDKSLKDIIEKAGKLAEIISGIAKPLKDASNVEVTKVWEILERTGDSIESIWENWSDVYSEDRIKHLIRLISDVVGIRIQGEFKQADLWGKNKAINSL